MHNASVQLRRLKVGAASATGAVRAFVHRNESLGARFVVPARKCSQRVEILPKAYLSALGQEAVQATHDHVNGPLVEWSMAAL